MIIRTLSLVAFTLSLPAIAAETCEKQLQEWAQLTGEGVKTEGLKEKVLKAANEIQPGWDGKTGRFEQLKPDLLRMWLERKGAFLVLYTNAEGKPVAHSQKVKGKEPRYWCEGDAPAKPGKKKP